MRWDTQVRRLPGRQFNVQKEATYIVDCASRQDARVVTIGPLVFFSTNTGDAWVLDPEDSLACCLCTNGQSLPSGITETIDNFSIAWEGRYRFEKESMIFTDNGGSENIFLGYPIKKIQRAIEKGRTLV